MTHLKAGDKAPEIKAFDQEGNKVSSTDWIGSKVVLYFYPQDDTPGCTKQACNLRDNYNALLKAGYKVYGVSADTAKKHKKFIEKYQLPFPLLVDEEKIIINAFGVWGPKKFMGREFDGIHRITFVINEKGLIEEIIDKVETKNHTAQILK